MEFHLVQNRKKNRHHDHIPFNVRGNVNVVFSVYKNSQTGKMSTIRLIAVQETGVSRHQGGPIEGPPETPRTSQHYLIEGINYVRGNVSVFFSV